jgi:hypothetical protein
MPSLFSLFLLSAPSFTRAQKTRIVLHTLDSLVNARIDPIVAPGKVSGHTHHVVGGSAFSPTYNPDALRKSKCTNLAVQADKSNYWQPMVYRVANNGTYKTMRTNTRIYYEQPHTAAGVKVEPFPYSFRMSEWLEWELFTSTLLT